MSLRDLLADPWSNKVIDIKGQPLSIDNLRECWRELASAPRPPRVMLLPSRQSGLIVMDLAVCTPCLATNNYRAAVEAGADYMPREEAQGIVDRMKRACRRRERRRQWRVRRRKHGWR